MTQKSTYKMASKITLKDFLLKYTAISEKFINEYYKFHKMCEIDPFGIEIQDLIKYLDIKRKEEFMQNFRTKFVENRDYIKKEMHVMKTKNISTTRYYMTLDTFKKIY